MRTDLLQRYGGQVPRYTSYPTAPHFHPGIDAATYADWLAALPDAAPVSLYVHVPFCKQMCWYCGCHTKVVARYKPIAEYLDALIRETELVADAIGHRTEVRHMHFGGGSPSMLAPDDFRRLMRVARGRFRFDAHTEVAVEMDPRGMDAARIEALAESGVNRASLGVQDFDPTVQRLINRVQSFEMVEELIRRLRAAGIEAVNLDLMYGLPGQSLESVLRSVELAACLRPARLALFGYAHVPWMKSHMKLIDEDRLPGPKARLYQAEAAGARLEQLGYVRIGLDHFAHPDDPMAAAMRDGALNRNFQGYTTDSAEALEGALIGLGASSIGQLPQGYVQNTPEIGRYTRTVLDGALATARGIAVSEDDVRRRGIIERLMCDMEIELDDPPAYAAELDALKPFAEDGVVELNGPRIRVTEDGRPFMRTVCAVFDRYLPSGAARHSQAV